jgi:hypothetical protein
MNPITGGPPPVKFIVDHLKSYRRMIPDPRWWDRHGLDLPLGGDDKRQLMVLLFGMRVPYPVDAIYRWFE